jgi:hypothetical protein
LRPTLNQWLKVRMESAMTNIAHQDDFKVEAYGTFTPPPVSCGGAECYWVETDTGWETIHSTDCEEN